MTPKGQIIKGFKATDKDMCCRGFQFELGKWYEHKDRLSLCSSGFHFCEYPSGPWEYYKDGRLFECEAEEVILSVGPGADLKHVANRIRLTKEIVVDGDGNTGNGNTGYRNTGNGNTGDWNTGSRNTGNGNTGSRNTGYGNTGYGNTGDGNTGYRNTGYWNTGDWNTGDWNTGDGNTGSRNTGNGNTGSRNTGNLNTGYGNTGSRNTGSRNTGYWNTGNGNTGYRNTGNRNTGNGNVGDCHSGDLCMGETPYFLFGLTADRKSAPHNLIQSLSDKLMSDTPIDPTPYLSIPNATAERIKALHDAHIAARLKKKGLTA